jgi:signal transduction histidine kinase
VLERLAIEDTVEFKTKPMASVVAAPHGHLSHLFTALRQGETVIGLQIFSRRHGGVPFTPTQCRIAAGIAELVSLSLNHAQVIDELERAHRVKSDFVATVSHELRTPLHVVMGYTDLLIDGAFGSLADEQTQALQRVRQRARGLLELINATLDLNRLEAGRINLDLEPTDLSELMKTLHRETGESQNDPNLRLIWDVPETLPIVSTDPAKLRVALKNLLANALKFTDAGSVTVRVAVDANEVEFTIADTGVGIAPDALPIVFEAFRQADSSSTRRFGGVGLGLYIVRRLVDLLGGQVDVESELGRGSTFRVRLPRSASH